MVQGDFFMKNKMLKKMTFASMISAVYFVLCLIEGYIASGPVANIRFAEGLIVMALFVPETIFGAALGCFLYNLFFGFGINPESLKFGFRFNFEDGIMSNKYSMLSRIFGFS